MKYIDFDQIIYYLLLIRIAFGGILNYMLQNDIDIKNTNINFYVILKIGLKWAFEF